MEFDLFVFCLYLSFFLSFFFSFFLSFILSFSLFLFLVSFNLLVYYYLFMSWFVILQSASSLLHSNVSFLLLLSVIRIGWRREKKGLPGRAFLFHAEARWVLNQQSITWGRQRDKRVKISIEHPSITLLISLCFSSILHLHSIFPPSLSSSIPIAAEGVEEGRNQKDFKTVILQRFRVLVNGLVIVWESEWMHGERKAIRSSGGRQLVWPWLLKKTKLEDNFYSYFFSYASFLFFSCSCSCCSSDSGFCFSCLTITIFSKLLFLPTEGEKLSYLS